jgi:hypothetical protein
VDETSSISDHFDGCQAFVDFEIRTSNFSVETSKVTIANPSTGSVGGFKRFRHFYVWSSRLGTQQGRVTRDRCEAGIIGSPEEILVDFFTCH